jgi:hypothetical protein
MAEVKTIKDEQVLRLAKKHCKPDEPWKTEHHSMLLWDYFRESGFLEDAKPEVIAQAGKAWAAFYSNSHSGYASNQAKHMAASGVCKGTASDPVSGQYS